MDIMNEMTKPQTISLAGAFMLDLNKNGVYQGRRTELEFNDDISAEVIKTIDRDPYQYHNDGNNAK